MFGKLISIALFATIFQYYNYYRAWLDWDRSVIYKNYPGPCRLVSEDEGTEDVTHIGNGIILASAGFNFDHAPGKLKAMDLHNERLFDMNISNIPYRPDNDFLGAPHGISAWKDKSTGKQFLYVLTHPKKEDRIEVFEVLPGPSLNYLKTITDPSFDLMNDLVVIGKDKFYITYYGRSREKLSFTLSDWAHLSDGKIYYYDGHKARVVASNYFRPNGINISPDKTTVYMAEWGRKILHGYRRESSNNLVQIFEMNLGSGIDNIEVDPHTGDLWIGSHPLTWKIADHFKILGSIPPSQVLRVKIRDNMVDEVEEVFADDGLGIMGSTAATYAKGKLVIGAVFNQAMVCDVKYLS